MVNVRSFPKAACPMCGKYDRVEVYDRGLKWLWRWVVRNNRFLCRRCRVTWRRRRPYNQYSISETMEG